MQGTHHRAVRGVQVSGRIGADRALPMRWPCAARAPACALAPRSWPISMIASDFLGTLSSPAGL